MFLREKGVKFLLMVLFIVVMIIVAAGCGEKTTAPSEKNTGTSTSQETSKQEPVKVGVLLPYSGMFTALGESITNGMEMYFNEVGNMAGGRPIVLIKEDTEGKPQTGLQKARKLVESDKVDLVAGIVSSAVAYGVRDYFDGNKVPLIVANAGASDLTREKRSPYIFRVSYSNGQTEYPMGTYAYETLGYRKVIVVAADYSAGHEKAIGFMEAFKKAGGEIVKEIYPKMDETDFAPYLTSITNMKADAVWAFVVGNTAVTFVKQYDEFGLKKKFPLIGSDLVDGTFLDAQGESPLGTITALHYSPEIDSPVNKEFVQAYQKKFKVKPNAMVEQGYIAARVMVEALEELKGNTQDKEKLLAAIRNVKFEAPQGDFKFDPVTQNVIFNTYILKTEKVNGEMINSVIHTIKDTADKWKP